MAAIPKRPSGLVVLVGGALLQYRWIGQVSDAERERRERALRHATHQVAHDLDLELARVLVGLSLDGETLLRSDWADYAERFAAWQEASAAPAMVREILLADGETGRLRLRRWDATTGTFTPAVWTPDLGDLRARLDRELSAWRVDAPEEPSRQGDLLSPAGDLIVAPVAPVPLPREPDQASGTLFQPVFGYTLIRLDLPFISETFLPELVERHFREAAAGEYRVAVVDRRAPEQVVYAANVTAVGELLAKHDADEDLFGIRPDTVRRAADAMRRLGAPGGERRRAVFFGFTLRRPSDGTPPPARPFEDLMRWRLVARHPAGSLEAAVEEARTRNLLLSFGILLLMAGSVATLAATTRRARRLAQQQIEFVAAVSHELRTPVSVIASAGDNLAAGVVTDPARVKQYGSRIQVESRRLGETVERVLLYAGIEAGRGAGHRTVVPVDRLIDEAASAVADTIAETGATLTREIAPGLPPVLADAPALRASVQNLLANALKYGGPRPKLEVSATTGAGPGGREVRIAVTDHGLGIAPAELPHIFEPFYRGREAQVRQIHGNGLGLAIVKGIVNAHGGRVTVQSRPGQGSTFVLHLPVADGQPATLDAGLGHVEAPARSS